MEPTLKFRTIAIIHHGENVPGIDGYKSLRYGRLAEELTNKGYRVIRISPSFSHSRRVQRPIGKSTSSEGEHYVVPTTGYTSNFGLKRLQFIFQLNIGAAKAMKELKNDLDVVIVGVPPPGVLITCRLVLGLSFPIIADVRDIWPDAFAVGSRKKWKYIAQGIGKIVSREMLLADRVTIVSEPMRNWVPSKCQTTMIPLGMSHSNSLQHHNNRSEAALRVCFVSNHTAGFDFLDLMNGWCRFCEEVEGSPLLTFVGAKPTDPEFCEIVARCENVEFLGRVMPSSVNGILCTYDVGLAPCSVEWEYSLGNKVFEYLATGLVVAHTINPEITKTMDSLKLSTHCERSQSSWHEAFHKLHEERNFLRVHRADRIKKADKLFGRAATTKAFLAEINELL